MFHSIKSSSSSSCRRQQRKVLAAMVGAAAAAILALWPGNAIVVAVVVVVVVPVCSAKGDSPYSSSSPLPNKGRTPPPPPPLSRIARPDAATATDDATEDGGFQQRRLWQSSYYTETENGDASLPLPPRPPPPSIPQQQQQQRTPIHYPFPSRTTQQLTEDDFNNDGTAGTTAGTTAFASSSSLSPSSRDGDEGRSSYASPRRDAVTLYAQQSAAHRLLLAGSCATVGASLGAFFGAALCGSGSALPRQFAVATAAVFMVYGTLLKRTALGELVRALGLLLILAVQRSAAIRRRYPAAQYLRAALASSGNSKNEAGRRRRRPFPPTSNPWSWRNDDPDTSDVEFDMLSSVLAMAVVGAFTGAATIQGVLPIVPTAVPALAGAAMSAYLTTLPSAQGDLFRCMGMRVAALLREGAAVAHHELALPRKAAVVAGKMMDGMLVLDRKHRIRDKVVAGAALVADRVSRVQSDMAQQQQQQQQAAPRRRRRRPPGAASEDDDDDDEYEGEWPPGSVGFDERQRRRPPAARYDDEGEHRRRRFDDNDDFRGMDDPRRQRQPPGGSDDSERRSSNSRPPAEKGGGGGWWFPFARSKPTSRGPDAAAASRKERDYPDDERFGVEELQYSRRDAGSADSPTATPRRTTAGTTGVAAHSHDYDDGTVWRTDEQFFESSPPAAAWPADGGNDDDDDAASAFPFPDKS